MKCMICRNDKVQPGHAMVTLERGRMTLVFKNVPALVCPNCGEEYIKEKVSAELLRTAEQAVREGVQFEVRSYVAA